MDPATPSPAGNKPPRYHTLASLQDGVNFRVIPGKHHGSKLVIHQQFGYSINKRVKDSTSGDSIYYLKCKYTTCSARGFIRRNFFAYNPDQNPHTCEGEGASTARWFAAAALARMKERAMKETSTLEVSVFYCLQVCYSMISPHIFSLYRNSRNGNRKFTFSPKSII